MSDRKAPGLPSAIADNLDFDEFLTDRVTLVQKDSLKFENIRAGVNSGSILIADISLPIEAGDEIKRALPSGLEETFVITEPGFQQAVLDFDAHYQIQYSKKGTDKPSTASSVTYNLSGQARVNINSVDQSTNIGSATAGATFDEVRDILRKAISDAAERRPLLKKVNQLEQAYGTGDFIDTYKEFVALAANHMSILAPVIPALTALL